MIWLFFALIQIVSFVLTFFGLLVISGLSISKSWILDGSIWHWPRWAWIWDNEIDGITPKGQLPTRWNTFYWTALRNPVNNLRFIPSVSKVGRPLFYRTWKWMGKDYYFKAGWMSDGFPCLSAGGGKGGG